MPTRRKITSDSNRLPNAAISPPPYLAPPAAGGVVPTRPPVGDYIQGDFYSEALKGADAVAMDKVRQIKLLDEIVLLRIVMRRVVQQAMEQELSLDAWLDALNGLSQAATRLARLLALEQTLAESQDNDLALLSQAIKSKMKEQGW